MSFLKHPKFLWISILLIFLVFPAAKPCCAQADKQTIIFFRYDDISGRSSTILEQKLIDLFRRHHFSFTVAVIPFVCDGDYHDPGKQGNIALSPRTVEMLRDAVKNGTVNVAMHGYSHQSMRKRKDGPYTEFSGVDYKSQEMKIIKGKRMLEEALQMNITMFVPPFNSYDLNTIRILENQGFTLLSANRFGVTKEYSSLRYLPITCELDEIREAVESAGRARIPQSAIGVMFHEFDFTDIDRKRGKISYSEFERLMDWLAARGDVRVMNIRQSADAIKDLGSRRYMENLSYYRMFKPLPNFIGKPKGIYLTSVDATREKLKVKARMVTFYLVTLFLTIALSFWQGKRFMSVSRLHLAIICGDLSAFLFLVGIYAFTPKVLGYRGEVVMIIILGNFIGFWMAYLRIINGAKNAKPESTACPGCSHERERHS